MQSLLFLSLQAELDQFPDAGTHKIGSGTAGGAGAALNAGQDLLSCEPQDLTLELLILCHFFTSPPPGLSPLSNPVPALPLFSSSPLYGAFPRSSSLPALASPAP